MGDSSTEVLYVDVDGTLTGPGGNLFAGPDHEPTLVAAEAVVTARRAGLELVPLSGRHRESVAEVARVIGADSWIGELGAIRSYDRGSEVVLDQGEYPGDGEAIHDLRRAGEELVALRPGTLEEHAPWNEHRLASYMLRGDAEEAELQAWLDEHDYGWADCIDNGVIPRRFDGLPGLEAARVFHLVPRGVSKAAAVAADRSRRGLTPEDCAAIGDAAADLACAAEVGRFFLVANALQKDPGLADAVNAADNAEVTNGAYGAGFADAVHALVG